MTCEVYCLQLLPAAARWFGLVFGFRFLVIAIVIVIVIVIGFGFGFGFGFDIGWLVGL